MTGYKGDRCQFCDSDSVLIHGVNGEIDADGIGVKCGELVS